MKKLHLAFISLAFLCFTVFQANATTTSIKVALILDTSNSMDGLIDQAKSQLWSVVNELSTAKCDGDTPDIEIALYEYGNDGLPMLEGYIRLVTPFTSDLDLISEKLFSLRTNGGSEFCGQVIESSLKELDWEDYPKDLKLIFIAGNEPFDQGNVSYKKVCKIASEKDITINTIFCGDYNEGVNTFWKDGACLGGGDYLNIDQDCSYVHIVSPYDDRIMKLNDDLNNTYVAYGYDGNDMFERQAEQDANAYALNAAAAYKRVSSKSKSVYKNAHWDLVDASEEESFNIEDIPEKDLPDEMKNMDKDEKLQYITGKKKVRYNIQKEISILSKQRDQYVADQRQLESGKMLDQAIILAVKKQAASKKFVFIEEE